MDDVQLRVRSVVIPASELRWRFSRSSGPGGQSVNTSDTRVELRYDVASSPALSEYLRNRALTRLAARLVDGELVITASEYRSQLRNREAAIARLVEIMSAALAPEPRARRATKVPKRVIERRLQSKRTRAEVKRNRADPSRERT